MIAPITFATVIAEVTFCAKKISSIETIETLWVIANSPTFEAIVNILSSLV